VASLVASSTGAIFTGCAQTLPAVNSNTASHARTLQFRAISGL
jgi:hypothetical protein